MKVLVATPALQGTAGGDYSWTLDGELVLAGAVLECCSPQRCGCGRGFPGLGSSKATTTAMVVDRPELTREQLWEAVRDSLDRDGWLAVVDEDEACAFVDEEVERIEFVVSHYPVGAVLSRSGTKVWQRGAAA